MFNIGSSMWKQFALYFRALFEIQAKSGNAFEI